MIEVTSAVESYHQMKCHIGHQYIKHESDGG